MKQPHFNTPKKIPNSKSRGNFTFGGPNSNHDNFSESVDIATIKLTSDTADLNSIQTKLSVTKSKLNECRMEAAPSDILAEVFKDLEMICAELFAVQRKLSSQNDFLNETDNDLYVSCVNDTIQLANEEFNATTETIRSVDSVTTEDYRQNTCDKIEICNNCGNACTTLDSEVKVPEKNVNLLEKWTQTEPSSNMTNETEQQLETEGPTIAAAITAEATLKSSQSIPIPPPMPQISSILPIVTSSTPPAPPPMPPPFPSNLSPLVPPSMPPPPPPIPPPMPGNLRRI